MRACRKLRLSSGRDSLLCQTRSRGDNVDYSIVAAIEADVDDLAVRELFVAADSTQRCGPTDPGDRIQKSVIDNIVLPDAKPARLSIHARYGEMPYTPRARARLPGCRRKETRRPLP